VLVYSSGDGFYIRLRSGIQPNRKHS